MVKTEQSAFVNSLIDKISRIMPLDVWKGKKSVVAVSGGADSVAMLNLLTIYFSNCDSSRNLYVAHCNHQTRPDSRGDQEFVQHLSERLGLKFLARERSRHADPNQLSDSEESMRNFRYESLIEMAHSVGARYVFTGHTEDDQIETILFRIMRGTGFNGLQGIPSIRVQDGITIVRPLLEISRSEIIEFLNLHSQDFRSDSSNSEDGYTRNFLRNKVLPLIKGRFGEKTDLSMLRLKQQSEELQGLLDELTGRFVEQVRLPTVDVNDLRNEHRAVIRHAFQRIWKKFGLPEQDMDWEKWNLVADLVQRDSKVLQLPGAITLKKQGTKIVFESTTTNRCNS